MPLDPSIIMANADPSRQFDPMKSLGNALQLKQMLQNTQMQGMQQQQLSQQLQDAQDLRDTLKAAAANGQDPTQAVEKLGSPLAQKYLGTMLDMRQKGVTLQKNQFDLANAHLSKVGNSVLAAANADGATPQSVAQMVQQHAQMGDIPGPQAQEMLTDLQGVKTPQDLKSWAQLQGVKLGVAKDMLGMFTPKVDFKDTGGAFVPVTTNPLTGATQAGAPVIQKQVSPDAKYHGAITMRGQDMGVGIYGGVPGMPMAPRPGAPAAPAAPGANPPAQGDPNDRLAMVPAGLRDLVRQIGTYQMLPTQIGPRQKTAVMNLVAQAYPNYSISDAEANNKFIKGFSSNDPSSPGGTIGAAERLIGHAGELADLTDKLGNSSFGKLGNAISGFIDTSTGTGQAGNIKAFELTKGKLIAELNKLANGGVPHAEEMASDVKQISYTDPPDVKYKVLQPAIQLGLEQVNAMETRRNNILGADAPQTSLLSPRAQAIVRRIYKNAGATPDLGTPSTAGYTNTAITNAPKPQGSQLPYAGKVLPQSVFNQLSADDKRKFISGGGRAQ